MFSKKSPKKSNLIGFSNEAGNISIIPPLIEKSPSSNTLPVSIYPEFIRKFFNSLIFIDFPIVNSKLNC